jgi:DNA-directed RNA polymerase specialized sigma24 family protein
MEPLTQAEYEHVHRVSAAERRRTVRRLRDDRGLSVRQIARLTGWSPSTVRRDLSDGAQAVPGQLGLFDTDHSTP